MWNSLGRNEKVAGTHGKFTVLQQEQAGSFQNMVHLVHSGMRMQGVLLSCSKRVYSNKQPCRLEDRAFSHPILTPFGVIGWAEDFRVIHGSVIV